MKRIKFINICSFLIALCIMTSFSGCGKTHTASDGEYGTDSGTIWSEQTSDGNLSDGSDGGEISGSSDAGNSSTNVGSGNGDNGTDSKNYTVSVGFSAGEKTEFEKLIPVFQKKYPNIKVTAQQISTSLLNITPKLTALAAANKMPDVVIGSENFGYIMQQGWAYPLDRLLNSDKDKSDVLEMGLSRYTYGGNLYALPYRLQFNGLVLNLDLLNEINEDKPDYNWTIDEFIRLAKKATTPKYSGINYIINTSNPTYSMDIKLMNACLPSGYEQFGYSMENKNFDLKQNNAWVESINLIKELRSVKGLVSDELKDPSLTSQGKVDDYDKKFGKNSDAYVSGKVLFGTSDSWNMSWWRTFKFNYDFYPIPTSKNIEQRIQTHVDFVFISSSVSEEKASAAFKLARFLSYDEDGCISRIESCLSSEKDQGSFRLYLPAIQNKKVIERFCSEKVFPEGMKYMLKQVVENPEQTLVADTDKIVPDFWQNVDQYRTQATEKVNSGTDPSSLVNDMQSKINSAMKTTQDYLDKKVAENLKKFYETHPNEK